MDLVAGFADLFRGLDRAYGRYVSDGEAAPAGAKAGGYAFTENKPVTPDLWKRHLDGDESLGIIPIRDGNGCLWGGIDVDLYPLDIEALSRKIRAMGVPLIPCLTKSGGAHLYMFLAEATPATVVRSRLADYVVQLELLSLVPPDVAKTRGKTVIEIFPKQDKLDRGGVGNWLNMPYFGGARIDYDYSRCAVVNGTRLTAAQFVSAATELRANTTCAPTPTVPDDEFADGPPCINLMAANGLGEGGRNIGLFAMGVFARKKYGDEGWKEKLAEYNMKHAKPPVGVKELSFMMRSLGKKDYFYNCNACEKWCNKPVCKTRKFGIGNADDIGVTLGQLVKVMTTPPIWKLEVNGKMITVSTETLVSQSKLNLAVIEALNLQMKPVKPFFWTEMINEKLANVQSIEVPEDADLPGIFRRHVENFLQRHPARIKEELADGRPWENAEDGRTYFRYADLKNYLQTIRFNDMGRTAIFDSFRSLGAESGDFIISGLHVRWWSLPTPTKKTKKDEEKF